MAAPFPLSQGFSAEFPDDARGPVTAVELRIGAGPARRQAFLAVSPLMLAAEYLGLGIGMVAAGLPVMHRFHHRVASIVRVRGNGKSTARLKFSDLKPKARQSFHCLRVSSMSWRVRSWWMGVTEIQFSAMAEESAWGSESWRMSVLVSQ